MRKLKTLITITSGGSYRNNQNKELKLKCARIKINRECLKGFDPFKKRNDFFRLFGIK